MSKINYEDLFSTFTIENALTTTESKKKSYSNPDVYKPSIRDEKCKDGNYRSLIRFMPFIYEDKVRTTIERWECFLRDVNDENAVFVVSPKTIGKRCPIRDMGWKLYSSESAIDKANSKKINVYQQWYALVEIVKDVQHPELDGKFMVYQFGKKIHDKIEDALKGSEFSDPINPFHFLEAPLFEINMTKAAQKMDGTREVAEYSSCKFLPEKKAPIHFGEGKTLEQSRESMDEYIKWLNEGAPKINDYQWKEWDQETTDKVNRNLATYTSSYSAPRSTAAAVNELVKDIQSAPEEKAEPAEADGQTINADEDDAWLKSVLG
jgi:hypothetical protein